MKPIDMKHVFLIVALLALACGSAETYDMPSKPAAAVAEPGSGGRASDPDPVGGSGPETGATASGSGAGGAGSGGAAPIVTGGDGGTGGVVALPLAGSGGEDAAAGAAPVGKCLTKEEREQPGVTHYSEKVPNSWDPRASCWDYRDIWYRSDLGVGSVPGSCWEIVKVCV